MTIKVIGIPHHPSAGNYSAKLVRIERTNIVCVEMHQENLESNPAYEEV